jgi:hypothetical protein
MRNVGVSYNNINEPDGIYGKLFDYHQLVPTGMFFAN